MSSNQRRRREGSPGVPQRSSGERSEPERSGGTPGDARGTTPSPGPTPPDPEVIEKARRRQYTAEYKLRVLSEVDAATKSGEIGAILRREGLYSSHLITWRRQRDEGALSALRPKRRGPKSNPKSASDRRLAELEAENQQLRRRLQEAQVIIEFQKKVSDVLGIPLSN